MDVSRNTGSAHSVFATSVNTLVTQTASDAREVALYHAVRVCVCYHPLLKLSALSQSYGMLSLVSVELTF